MAVKITIQAKPFVKASVNAGCGLGIADTPSCHCADGHNSSLHCGWGPGCQFKGSSHTSSAFQATPGGCLQSHPHQSDGAN